MAKTTIITVGKVKEPFARDGVAEFAKRLSKNNLQFLTVSQSTKEKEAKELVRLLTARSNEFIVCMDEHGLQMSSAGFAEFITKYQELPLCFVIGGPDGLAADVLKLSHFKLSLSHMTFTHRIALLFLIEQIYRAQTIIDGKTYHGA